MMVLPATPPIGRTAGNRSAVRTISSSAVRPRHRRWSLFERTDRQPCRPARTDQCSERLAGLRNTITTVTTRNTTVAGNSPISAMREKGSSIA